MDFTQTVRTKLKRLPNRGVFERSAVYRILDEGFICHVGFVVDGNPVVIPTGYARAGDQLLIHGSQASRMLRTLKEGFPACVTVTLVDGLVLARSAFHHSINYRSVVIFGTCSVIVDPVKKNEALRLLSEHIIAGRWDEVRPPTDAELSATTVLSLPLLEASAKVRTGPPIDDEEDYSLNVWAGVIPLTMEAGPPVPDPRLPAGVVVPDSARHYRRNQDST
ncbi:MAG TPA: pyridoxamine 5'-phosphate oxidase family protein [Pyrinomonadaceae bacterium]|nr:pyridoxamine 5'-phosphate oxidase family protein [Pyrinomonadaceae bacterium]